jgi:hypothetical protein
MLKLGLLLVLANIFLKLFIGIGLWKMAMENKSGGVKSSLGYNEEQIGEGDPNILRGQNDFNGREGGIFPGTGSNDNFNYGQNEEE